MTAKPIRMCGSCRRGGIYDVRADWMVTGFRTVEAWTKTGPKDRKQSFRANVCDDHLYCLDQDGATILTKREIRHA